MIEERLEIIKENVYMRSEIAKISRLGIDTSLGEELELLKEIDRLNNIINELEKWLEEETRLSDEIPDTLEHSDYTDVLDKLKALKENNK